MFRILFVILSFMTSPIWAQNYGGNYDWRMLGGIPMQLVSFHIGSSTSINHAQTGYNIGGSAGLTYISAIMPSMDGIEHIFDTGARIKYMYSDNKILKSHLVGAEIYLHFPFSTSDLFKHTPQPISLVFGGGGIFVNDGVTKINGQYVECGIGLFKFFPINASLLYRFSFFPENNFMIDRIEQSFHIEFSIF